MRRTIVVGARDAGYEGPVALAFNGALDDGRGVVLGLALREPISICKDELTLEGGQRVRIPARVTEDNGPVEVHRSLPFIKFPIGSPDATCRRVGRKGHRHREADGALGYAFPAVP